MFSKIVDPLIEPKTIDDDEFIFCCPEEVHVGDTGMNGGAGYPGGDYKNAMNQCLGKRPSPEQVWRYAQEVAKMFGDLLRECRPYLWLRGRAGKW